MTKLYKLDSKNKVREWEICISDTLTEDGYKEIVITHGLQDGKKQTKTRYVKSGKNIGKANETSLDEQAKLEVQSLIQSQLDGSYVYDINDYVVPRQPQLAFKYKEKAHTIDWTNRAYTASKKLNGIRCFVFVKDGKVVKYQSRTGKDFKHFTHLTKDIEQLLSTTDTSTVADCILDGELFHPTMPFECIASSTNSTKYVTDTDDNGNTWSTDMLQLHCYDFINLDKADQNYVDRFVDTFIETTGNLIKVDNVLIESEEQLQLLGQKWIKEGYEGLMLRDCLVPYDFGKRTKYLLKYKIMMQDEFLIKNIYLAENDSEKVMFTLYNHLSSSDNKDTLTFECALKGSKKLNMDYFNNKSTYVDKAYLTVDYQALSAYNVPLFPVGVSIREGTVVDGQFVPSV